MKNDNKTITDKTEISQKEIGQKEKRIVQLILKALMFIGEQASEGIIDNSTKPILKIIKEKQLRNEVTQIYNPISIQNASNRYHQKKKPNAALWDDVMNKRKKQGLSPVKSLKEIFTRKASKDEKLERHFNPFLKFALISALMAMILMVLGNLIVFPEVILIIGSVALAFFAFSFITFINLATNKQVLKEYYKSKGLEYVRR